MDAERVRIGVDVSKEPLGRSIDKVTTPP